MSERARALGGHLEAGATVDGWRVDARLPLLAAPSSRADLVMIRVIVVDDQPVVRSGIVRILGPDDGFEVVAECGDGDEVVAAVAEHAPTWC